MYKKYLNGDQVYGLLTLVTLFAVLLNNSCCPLPPGNLMSPRGVIADKVIKSLQQEGTTREDLLFLVGEPDMRGMQDRRFIYTWTAEYSYYRNIVLETHYLLLEFDEGNRIKRLRHIDPSSFSYLLNNARDGVEELNEVSEWLFEFKK